MSRVEKFKAFWVSSSGVDLGEVETSKSGEGSLEMNTNAQSKIGGRLTVVDIPNWVNPLKDRMRIEASVDSTIIPLGTYLIDIEDRDFILRGVESQVILLDQLRVVAQDKVAGPYVVPAGSNIVDAAVTVLRSTGETRMAVTRSTATLPTPQVWEPATPKLEIINDLLAIAGYWSLRTDPLGYFTFQPYILPDARPITREFVAGDGSQMKANYTKSNNYSGIPNKFIAFSPEYDAKDSNVEDANKMFTGLVGVAELTNPESPYSFANRGRWIVESDQVEAATHKEIDLIAQQRLISFINPAVNISVEHALFKGLWLDKVIRNVPSNGEPYRGTVTEMTIPLKPGGLVSGVWREVTSLA